MEDLVVRIILTDDKIIVPVILFVLINVVNAFTIAQWSSENFRSHQAMLILNRLLPDLELVRRHEKEGHTLSALQVWLRGR